MEGSRAIPAAELEAALADRVGKPLGFAGLQAAADAVAAYYRERGLHATAYLPEQSLEGGMVRIVVAEGRLGRIQVSSPAGARLPVELIEQMMQAGQQPGQVIQIQTLARAARLANEVPGVEASVTLAAGAAPGETDVKVVLSARPVFDASITLDNHDAIATGEVRASAALQWANPLGLGEDWQLQAQLSEGKRHARVSGSLALGAQGTRAQWQASALQYELVGRFSASGASGSARTLGIGLSHPLLRLPQGSLNASLMAEQRSFVNDSTAGVLSDKSARTLSLSFSGDRSDNWAGGGVTTGSFTMTTGSLDLSGEPADALADAAGPRRAGAYAKLGWQLARLQRLAPDTTLWLQAYGQQSDNNLDSSERISLGGPSGVRAYPLSEVSGDSGTVATVEVRHRFSDAWQLAAFVDHGRVRQDARPWGASSSQSLSLNGVGLAAEWRLRLSPSQSVITRLTLAQRLGRHPAPNADGSDSDGTLRKPRVWLSVQGSL
ncbi:MAG: ShlB/FhaC/HecB family hemolysin secretion/activation protein [Rubrivivax sp.]|nr:ShlB/FhaC/HecB family hemolysin secretion/activation protein [Rubrivivax sp.]